MEERKKDISRKCVVKLFNEIHEEDLEHIPMKMVEFPDGAIAVYDGWHGDCSVVTNENIKTKLRQLF